jgi:hypothetical protein
MARSNDAGVEGAPPPAAQKRKAAANAANLAPNRHPRVCCTPITSHST